MNFFQFVMCLCVLAMIVTSQPQKTELDSIPNEAKAKARFTTCTGGCLHEYPAIKKFIKEDAFGMSGLEVLFLGSKPHLAFAQEDGTWEHVENLTAMSYDEIVQVLKEHGVHK